MGIVRETIQSKVLEGNDGRSHLEELIDLAMEILSDNTREVEMNLLNNVQNNMVNNFWSIKWIFHETKEIKNRLHSPERKEGEDVIDRHNKLDNMVTEVEKRMESFLHNTANQSFNIIKALSDNIKTLHTIIEVSTGIKDDMENEDIRVTKDDVNPLVESLRNRTRSYKKKRDIDDSPNDIQLMSEMAKTMEILVLKVIELVKSMVP